MKKMQNRKSKDVGSCLVNHQSLLLVMVIFSLFFFFFVKCEFLVSFTAKYLDICNAVPQLTYLS